MKNLIELKNKYTIMNDAKYPLVEIVAAMKVDAEQLGLTLNEFALGLYGHRYTPNDGSIQSGN